MNVEWMVASMNSKANWKCFYLGKRIYVYSNPSGPLKVFVDGTWASHKKHSEIYEAAKIFAANGGYAGLDLKDFLENALGK